MQRISNISKLIRYLILTSTTTAGSGHPTSSLSATDLMSVLFFNGFFRFQLNNPQFENNDRLIFSKGHASPLFYALWVAAGAITEDELMTLRKFKCRMDGHPTMEFPFTEIPTGSLGQGLSAGVGMALFAKQNNLNYKTYVLLGDSEMAEGSVWEAIQIAKYYNLDNLIGIIDVNRLGQRGETMYSHDLEAYRQRISAFGWETIVIDGHNLDKINDAFSRAINVQGRPVMVIAKTIKGKGISFLEDKDNWHGKVLSAGELKAALDEIGPVDLTIRGSLAQPQKTVSLITDTSVQKEAIILNYPKDKAVATRKAYGNALLKLVPVYKEIVVLDAEVSNSTYADSIKQSFSERFYEMFIAEQNMVGTALGFARRGAVPFVSTFAAFFTRAFDQIRMSGLADVHIVFVGSHAGVSIGEDGASQMGLEDLAMFRTVWGSTVLYPSDAVSTERLAELAVYQKGIVYIRTTRKETPILYDEKEEFHIGGSKVHKLKSQNSNVKTTVQSSKIIIIAAGITTHEALKAQNELSSDSLEIVVIDCYSIKPIDKVTLIKECWDAKAVLVVEDHYEEGGIADAVRSVIDKQVLSLAVRKKPRSGKPEELLDYEEISSASIVSKIK